MLAPVWRGRGVGVHAGMIGKGIMQQEEESIDFGIIFLLSLLDRGLSQIVAQHVFGIDLVHTFPSLGVGSALLKQACAIASGPAVKPVPIHEEIAKAFILFVGR